MSVIPALFALPPLLRSNPPVLRFNDCKTRREIVLVGCMHNNPASIRLVQETVREYAANEALGRRAGEGWHE